LLDPFRRINLPRKGRRVGLCIVLFEACSAFTRVTACTLALSPYFVTRFTEGFSRFVASTAAPVASGGSTSPGGVCTHWNNIAFSRRTPIADVSRCQTEPDYTLALIIPLSFEQKNFLSG
jgi:hypothetical protein